MNLMPFKSTKQIGKFAQLVKEGKMKASVMKRWLDETPSVSKLPEKKKK